MLQCILNKSELIKLSKKTVNLDDGSMTFKKMMFEYNVSSEINEDNVVNVFSAIQDANLDMVFMMNRAKSTSKKSIIHLVMGIAGELDLDVIAEGVETLEDVNYLKTVGCRFAQGYFYERPIPDKEFVKLLTKMKIEQF